MLARSLVASPLGSVRPFQSPATIYVPRSRRCVILAAKKKGGGGGGKAKKGAGSLADPPKAARPYLTTPVIMHNLLLVESYFRKSGRPLFDGEIEISEVAKTLWEAPFPVLAHDATTDPPGPVFVYANRAALDLFEAEWEELIGQPSTKSAEPINEIQDDRSSALAQVLEKGFMDNYQGNRISFKGTKFTITKATLFNVEAPSAERVGQAAIIRSWEFEDGRKGGEGSEEESTGTADGTVEGEESGTSENSGTAAVAATPEEIAAAEAAVAEQAAAVRALKDEQGLTNSSPEVEAAVAVLLERKAALEALRK